MIAKGINFIMFCSIRLPLSTALISCLDSISRPINSADVRITSAIFPPVFFAMKNTCENCSICELPDLDAKSSSNISNGIFITKPLLIIPNSPTIAEFAPNKSSISFSLSRNAFSIEYPALSKPATDKMHSLNCNSKTFLCFFILLTLRLL